VDGITCTPNEAYADISGCPYVRHPRHRACDDGHCRLRRPSASGRARRRDADSAAHGYAYSHGNTYTHTYRDSHAHGNAYAHGNPHPDTNAYGNPHSHTYRNADRHGHAHGRGSR